MQMLDSRASAENAGGYSQPQQMQNQYQQPQQQNNYSQPPMEQQTPPMQKESIPEIDIDDDEIPF